MLKMNELVKQSGTPKSTILYYVKEGILPEPQKDKPNFHRYDERCIELLAFIKYLQSNFHATISQIKALFASEQFDMDNPYKSLMYSLSIIMGAEEESFTGAALCREFALSSQELTALVDKGLLSPRDGIFTAKERDILAILCRCDDAEREIVETYLQTAKSLAQQEVNITLNALRQSEEKDEKLKHLLDLLLVLKPYLFNMQTLNTYQQGAK